MYRAIAEFLEIGIAQKRGTQRAILPQALAIILAAQFIERVPPEKVLDHFNQPGRERLFKSFTRRLGFLHQSGPACKIAQRLLGPDGSFGDPTSLAPENHVLFENLAPTAPKEALAAMERAVKGPHGQEFISIDNPNQNIFIRLARNLAFETEFFERAASLLLAFAKSDPRNLPSNEARREFLEMFYIKFSRTKAPQEQRYRFLDKLFDQGDEFEKQLAIEALKYSLNTNNFHPDRDGQFGSWPRGQEWRPKGDMEQANWFQEALTRLVSIACMDNELAISARKNISANIIGLINSGRVDELIMAIKDVRKNGFWAEGWRQLYIVMHSHSKGWPAETQTKMEKVEQLLKPVSLENRFLTYVTNDPFEFFSIEEVEGKTIEEAIFDPAEKIGVEAANLPNVWPSLVNQAIAYNYRNASHAFGSGLAKGANDVCQMWSQITSLFCDREPETRNPAVLCGFLEGANACEPDTVQNWLDDALMDEALGPHIVKLSRSLPIDQRSIMRLTKAVRDEIAPLGDYQLIRFKEVINPTLLDGLIEFLRVLSATESIGFSTAACILDNYFSKYPEESETPPKLLVFGREFLQSINIYENLIINDDYCLEVIAKRCLAGKENEQSARYVCEKLWGVPESHIFKLSQFMHTLANLHPKAILEIALASDDSVGYVGQGFFGRTNDQPRDYSYSSLNDNVTILLDWVTEEPSKRAIRLARYVAYFNEDDQDVLFWSPIAEELIKLPGIGLSVLSEFYSRFDRGSGSGLWSDRLSRRRPLLTTLIDHADESVRSWANDALIKLDAQVARYNDLECTRDERFE